MKIVLKEDIFKLGKEGDEVEVRDGFARNHLLPKGLAVFANKHNLEIFRQKKRSILKKQETKKQLANELKINLDSVKLEFFMKSNDSGKLFHSVNNLNIAEELAKMGFELERKKIEVPHGSLKSFGTYDVNIKLYEGISSLIKVEIKEELEKSMQKKEKKTEKV